MRHDPDPAPVTLPRTPPEPPPAGLPVIAIAAPLLAAGVLWAITRSPLALAFAMLGPVLAVAHAVDGRRQRRAAARRAARSTLRALERLDDEVAVRFAAERARLARLAPEPARIVAVDRWPDGVPALRLGTAPVASRLRTTGDDDERPPPVAAAIAAFLERRSVLEDCPLVADAAAGVVVVGPERMSRPTARAIALQLAAGLPPDTWSVQGPDDEPWLALLPHPRVLTGPATDRGGTAVEFRAADRPSIGVAWTADARRRSVGRSVLRLDAPGSATARLADGTEVAGVTVHPASRADAASAARRLGAAARRLGLIASAFPPDLVALGALLAQLRPEPAGRGLRAPIGRDADGPVTVDLVTDGPHAVVAGTTGSGKSELLVAWVLAMAARHPPDRLSLLLVDFKGGAGFAPLIALPHVVGVVTDLDRGAARRAMLSLGAEVQRRERMLAEAGLPSIDAADGAGLPRLVVVVDEYAALVADDAELHGLVADLAARGRSLGLHLVLCTQRPAGSIREAVLANVGLRLCLRVADRADSAALMGDESAALLPAFPRGRVVLAGPAGRRTLQVALAAEADRETVAAAWPGAQAGRAPWVPPPGDLVPLAGLAAERWPPVLGVVDRPERQRVDVARWRPERDGHLLVVGGRRAGTTTALATLAAAGRPCWLPADPADAWGLVEALEAGASTVDLVLIDDLDALLDRFGDERRMAFAQLLGRLLRRPDGPPVVAAAKRLPSASGALMTAFSSRLLLALPSRDEQVLAGGTGAEWRPRRAGAGRWRDGELQVAVGVEPPAPARCELPRFVPPPAGLAVVTARPAELAARLRAAGRTVRELDGTAAADPPGTVVLGDPDAWQTAWTALISARRGALVVDRCTAAELRAVTRIGDPPPLGDRDDEAWLLGAAGTADHRRARRVTVDWDAPARDRRTADRPAAGS